MHNRDDGPMYRTFEEFEREELRRAEPLASPSDPLFDQPFDEELDFDAVRSRLSFQVDADDEE